MGWVDACAADDILPEDVIRFDHDGRTFAVYRTEDDRYFATDGLCTHEQVHLSGGLVMGTIIECPKHNGRFDFTTGKAKGADADDWQRTAGLAERVDKARNALNEVGARRLVVAIRILVEERRNLDAYLVELRATKADTRRSVADVLAAAYADVVGEMENLVLRSEVGLLDVAWGMKEAETSQIETLQQER